MPTLVSQPTRIRSAGNKPKLIDEYIGRVNSEVSGVSVAHMRSPGGWEEPGQRPEFEEFTIVLHEWPDLDCIVSAYLAVAYLTTGTLPQGLDSLIDSAGRASEELELLRTTARYATRSSAFFGTTRRYGACREPAKR